MTVTALDIVEFAAKAETITLRVGDVLFREGDDGDALYIVRRGTLQIVSGSTVYETVTAGGIVGEMAIIEEGAPRSATVIATALPNSSRSTPPIS